MQKATQTDPGRDPRDRDPVDPLVVVAGIITTILLHGTLVGLVIWGTSKSDEKIEDETDEKKMEFEDVELLAMGKEKPDHQLPRKANPPTPDPEQETVTLEDEKKEEKPDPEKKEKPEQKTTEKTESKTKETAEKDDSEDREREMQEAFDSLNNPNRPTNDDVPEGSDKGVAGGSISDEAMANLMGTFQAKLLEVLGKHWQVPATIPEEELQKLFGKVVVYVRLSKSGHVVSYRFRERSPNEQFNSSIERLLRRFEPTGGGKTLPLPENEEVEKVVLREGLNLKNWEVTQR